MRRSLDPAVTETGQYLRSQEQIGLLRFITCGSAGDGKSTLIGRLLYESNMIFEDHLAALEADSGRIGTQGQEMDFALLVDGLAAERQQGITIDVAYRFFATDKRRFIVADTPGHEQYTRNMVTGASTADVAVLLVDARKGVLTQTRRHLYLASLLGIRQVLLAVNKLDLLAYSKEVFERIESEFRSFASALGSMRVTCVPVSALKGDNILSPSPNMPWYRGPTLMGYLDGVEIENAPEAGPFRMQVQWVNRPDAEFRGFSGRIVGGRIRAGDRVRVLPSGLETTVARIVTMDGDLQEAMAGQSVTITLTEEIDVTRGDVLAGVDAPPGLANQFQATLVWMHEDHMLPGRPYLLKMGARTVGASVSELKHRININSLEHLAAKVLELNEIGVCNLNLDRAVAFDPFAQNRDMGAFILIDRLTNNTVGAGMLHFALRRADNIHWQGLDINRRERGAIKGQRPCVLWFTGLSGAGKSTIANLVEKRLFAEGRHTYLLDGDNVRHGLCMDLGFTEAARVENIRRVSEVAKLMADAGLITLVSFISPFRAERRLARSLIPEGEFFEIFVDAPIEVAEKRDPKGLYKKARRGELKNFTGIDSPYEPPDHPEIRIDSLTTAAERAADLIIARLREAGRLELP
jgi:bifunctional enzyme CysN/CysC